MIVKHQKFEYQNHILIERLIIKPPFRLEAVFQNKGCFVYSKGADSKILSSNSNMYLDQKHAVLLSCGTYFMDWFQSSIRSPVEVVAFHLHPDILKKLYHQQVPKTLSRNSKQIQNEKLIPEHLITQFVESLNFYFDHKNLVNEDLLELKIKELILLLVQSKNAQSVYDLIESIYSPKTIKLKEIVELHLYETLSVEELAKLCNSSITAFKRYFKQVYDDSPAAYINKRRIEKAKELLINSTMSISEISYQVGFQDSHYFARLFKKQTSKTPTAYRKALVE